MSSNTFVKSLAGFGGGGELAFNPDFFISARQDQVEFGACLCAVKGRFPTFGDGDDVYYKPLPRRSPHRGQAITGPIFTFDNSVSVLHNEEAINNRRHGLPNDSERKAVYLDVCALLRPYDDQSQMRVSMETDAVNMILVAAKERKVILRTSPVHAVELQESVGDEENIATLELLGDIATPIIPSKATRARAEFWADQGIGLGDAAHLAFAESAGADFITCDDRLIKRVLKSRKAAVWVGNPVGYCEKELLK